jgi:serine/threonine-protein kinase RsbW
VTADGPIVGLRLQSRPQTLTIIRGMLSGVAELLAMDPELLDDLKTAVSEACNNVVIHAYEGRPGPMALDLFASQDGLRVTVDDEGVGLDRTSAALDATAGIGVSVIHALTETASFAPRPDGGTEVTMDFAADRDGHRLFVTPGRTVPLGAFDEMGGPTSDEELVLSFSPVGMLAGVLGRLARTLAATAHFSLDRFSDVYLITDALAAHAARHAQGERIGARMSASDRRLELTLGPFTAGAGAELQANGSDRVGAPLSLADEVQTVPCGDGEAVRIVVIDRRS